VAYFLGHPVDVYRPICNLLKRSVAPVSLTALTRDRRLWAHFIL